MSGVFEPRKAEVIGERVAAVEVRVDSAAREVEDLRSSLSGLSERLTNLELTKRFASGWLGGAGFIGAALAFLAQWAWSIYQGLKGQ
jgi:hypothetical protein